MMRRVYRVIDADGHVAEPLGLWTEYMDPAYRDRAPRMYRDRDGRDHFLLDGQQRDGSDELSARRAAILADGLAHGRKGGFDPHARISDMDLDGIDAAFLYPSTGLYVGSILDPGLAVAMCRAYNRWLADYCKPYPDRLFGIAMLPMQSIDSAIEEMRFARSELGFRGGFVRPNPYGARTLHDRACDPFWSAAENLDFAIGLHASGNSGMPTVGVERFASRGAQHILSHTMEMMLACMSMIWAGVVERHPKLRVAFLESGGGWILPWLDRMDRHFDEKSFNDSGLTMRPTELFRRNCWISFEPAEQSISAVAEHLGAHKILWATDYPHRDGFFPGAPRMILDRFDGASPETKHQVMAGGAIKFYGLS
ncbi:MAG TPA: amidohydrolase family protein [Stellaceae bacterium]|nr:amidohydrolase family protein [Stellaceae bacterium]